MNTRNLVTNLQKNDKRIRGGGEWQNPEAKKKRAN